MPSTKNYLILKGEIPILRMLDFLENVSRDVQNCIAQRLSIAVEEKVSQNQLYEPWQMFGHIAASGNAGLYGLAFAFGSSIQKCRKFETSICASQDALDQKDFTIVKSLTVRRLKDSLEKLIVHDNNDSKKSGISDIGTKGFAWIPGLGNTGRSFLATYKHDLNPPQGKILTNNEMLFEAFCVGSVPDRDFPLRDLCLPGKDKHGEVCICLKGPTLRSAAGNSETKGKEIENERDVATSLKTTNNSFFLEYVYDHGKGAWEVTGESNTTLEKVVEIISDQILPQPPLRKPEQAVLAPGPAFI